ncbi:glycoside hydrolase family 3 protein [Penicillium alfredii]|uniref:beta-glucosidase n=1 Tax=Penicillium alfredii TaxID=1506179 RepID=A0A9W9F9T1_9EURO|nr:glycoside hydrolase family 3 protein [Penicillium alfredii]KAJ5096204.1 glycoside hydrolase family 3 protein [Penicillium alfredii]
MCQGQIAPIPRLNFTGRRTSIWVRIEITWTSILSTNPRKTILNAQRQRHRYLARVIAAAGTVLLKNSPGKKGLPLRKPTTIALCGQAAGPNSYGPNQYLIPDAVLPSEFHIPQEASIMGLGQGTPAEGMGSGSTFYPRLQDLLSAAIQQRANQDLPLVDWSLGHNITFAATVAQRATVYLPVVASVAGEGIDRSLTLINNGDKLITTVADNCDNSDCSVGGARQHGGMQA